MAHTAAGRAQQLPACVCRQTWPAVFGFTQRQICHGHVGQKYGPEDTVGVMTAPWAGDGLDRDTACFEWKQRVLRVETACASSRTIPRRLRVCLSIALLWLHRSAAFRLAKVIYAGEKACAVVLNLRQIMRRALSARKTTWRRASTRHYDNVRLSTNRPTNLPSKPTNHPANEPNKQLTNKPTLYLIFSRRPRLRLRLKGLSVYDDLTSLPLSK